MDEFWEFLRDSGNRDILYLIGGFLLAVTTGGWAVFKYIHSLLQKPKTIAVPESTSIKLAEIAEELGITKAAHQRFFELIGEDKVPVYQLAEKFREFAEKLKASEAELLAARNKTPEIATLKHDAGAALAEGDIEKAVKLLRRAVANDLEAAEGSQTDAAATLAAIAEIKALAFDFRSAQEIFAQAAALMAGIDTAAQAAYLNRAGLAAQDRAQYDAAEAHLVKALALREAQNDIDLELVAQSLNNLAGLHASQGNYGGVKPLYERALAIKEKSLGPDHPDVATTLNNLAELLRTQGEYRTAEPLFKRALAIREQALSPYHPDIANSLNNLALLYEGEGNYEAAKPLSKRALAIVEQALGPYHPHVATTLNNLAGIHFAQGEYDFAEPLYERAIAILDKAFEPDHPDSRLARANLEIMRAERDSK